MDKSVLYEGKAFGKPGKESKEKGVSSRQSDKGKLPVKGIERMVIKDTKDSTIPVL